MKLKIRNSDVFIITACTFCILMAAILYSNLFPELNVAIKGLANSFVDFGTANGLWSAFLLSMFGNTSILIVIPYSYIVFQLAIAGSVAQFPAAYPFILGAISGIGAGVGEVTSYVVGRLFGQSKKLINSDLGQKFDRMRVTFEKHPKSIPFIVYLFAVTPLPDDIILVPFGVMKYSYWKTIIPCMLGKMTLCLLISALGFFGKDLISAIPVLDILVPDPDSNPGNDMLSLLPLFIIVYIMIRADFSKLLSRKKKGVAAPASEVKPAGTKPKSDTCPKCGRPLSDTIVTERATGKRKKMRACGTCDVLV